MHIHPYVSLLAVGALAPLMLTGCAGRSVAPSVHEASFALDGVTDVTISYDEEDIRFLPSGSDELILREYISRGGDRYHAHIQQGGGSLHISEGEKPLFKEDFQRRVEVYFPASYHENLTVTATGGGIDLSETPLTLTSLRIDCTSGTLTLAEADAADIYLSSTRGRMELGALAADRIRLDTTAGEVECRSLSGEVSYTTTSGSATFAAVTGGGSWRVNQSGTLEVACRQVTGDLTLYNKNGSIALSLPSDLAFRLEAVAKNGTITTNFPECLAVQGDTVSGAVGERPAVTVRAETKNGGMEVTR